MKTLQVSLVVLALAGAHAVAAAAIEGRVALPKTRSGKVMRRVIRAAWLGLDPGDLSALDDPSSVAEIAARSPLTTG